MQFSSKFVCEDRERSTYEKHVSAPIFRKSITIMGKVSRAEILICGLGFYDLFINGKKITKGYLAPYISNTDHITYYDHYDLKGHLRIGENVIGIMLGDGFQNGKTICWDFINNVFNSSPKLALSMEIEGENGVISADAGDFHCKKGPITFNDLRSGVFYDKRLEETGWNMPGFSEDDSWHEPLEVDTPRGVAKLCGAEPIVITKELRPIRIYRGSLEKYEIRQDLIQNEPAQELPPERTGGWIYDFGENNAGIYRLKIKGKPGQRIDIQCAEIEKDGVLDYRNCFFYPNGYVQRDIYIVGSEKEEVFEPMFTYHGYRYLYVSGITEEQATEDLLTYLVMSSDLENRGDFRCSDNMANRIYEAARRSDISNFYYFPTDCPQREKNGWTGDAAASAEHMILTIGAEKSWREWLCNIRCAQLENGQIPGVVPTGSFAYLWGNGPAWDNVLFTLPYTIYRYRGETDIILENSHAMLSYLDYIRNRRNEKGILEFGLGDWVPVDKPAAGYTAPLGFTDTVMTYQMCRMAAEMFEAVGQELNRSYVQSFGEELYQAIRREYVDENTMLIKSRCQTAQAMGIYYDIFKENEKPAAFQQLLAIIHDCGDKIDAGFLGFRVIFHVLSQFGESQLAWDMITRKEYPSYGWYMENGYTTLPEQFYWGEQTSENSRNHHFLGDVVQWFMRYPAGLQVENYHKVIIKPSFLEGLDFAEASHTLPAGEVKVSWKRFDGKICLDVSCPKDVECDIKIESNVEVEVYEH